MTMILLMIAQLLFALLVIKYSININMKVLNRINYKICKNYNLYFILFYNII